MAMGLPTVAFATAVARELLGPHGVYAPPGNPFALADRIAELLADPARCRQLGALLRQRACEEFSWRDSGHRLAELYGALLCRSYVPFLSGSSRRVGAVPALLGPCFAGVTGVGLRREHRWV